MNKVHFWYYDVCNKGLKSLKKRLQFDQTFIWQDCRKRRGWGAFSPPPQFLAVQLTLSNPGRGRLCPPQYYEAPQIFRPCNDPVL